MLKVEGGGGYDVSPAVPRFLRCYLSEKKNMIRFLTLRPTQQAVAAVTDRAPFRLSRSTAHWHMVALAGRKRRKEIGDTIIRNVHAYCVLKFAPAIGLFRGFKRFK